MDTGDDDAELSAVLGDSEDVIVRLDKEGRFSRLLCGSGVPKPPAHAIGLSFEDFFPPAFAARVLQAVARATLNRLPVTIELDRPGPGPTRLVRAHITPTKDGGCVAYFRDITSERATALELGACQRRQEHIARATRDAIFDWDLIEDVLVWNERLAGCFGHAPETVPTPSAWQGLIHIDDRGPRGEALRAVMNDPTEDRWSGEYRVRDADGRWRQVTEHSLFLRDASGRALRVVGAVLDITERRALEARVALADRIVALSTLTAGMAHEINTPLNYIVANTALAEEKLAQRAPDVPAALACLREAFEGVSRVRSIVGALKAMSRGDDDVFEPFSLRAVVETALRMLDPALTERGAISAALDDVPDIYGSAHRIGQVVTNLLVNALQSLPHDRDNRVHVSLAQQGSDIVLSVSDTGRGISKKNLPHLFDPFFTTKTPREGSGLGLAIAHAIVTRHGGCIDVRAQEPRGTIFRVLLPLCSPAALAADQRTAGKPAADKISADKISADKISADKPSSDKPSSDEAAPHQPCADDESAADKPAALMACASRSSIEAADGLNARGAAVRPADPRAASPEGTNAPRRAAILVVDDDELSRSLIRRILECEHDIVTVGDAETALEAVKARPFDIVLSDVVMPGFDGPRLYLAICELGRPLKFAFLTGQNRGASPADAVPSLDKPFTPDALRRFVRELHASP